MKCLVCLVLTLFAGVVSASPVWYNNGWTEDFNGDGYVNVIELGILATNYDRSWPANPPGSESHEAWAAGDRNFDNRIDAVDLGILAYYYDDAFYYHNWPPINGVPEPAILMVLALGGLALLRKSSHPRPKEPKRNG
jgi:hypothetical protein